MQKKIHTLIHIEKSDVNKFINITTECRQSRHSLIFVIKYFWVIKSVNKEK